MTIEKPACTAKHYQITQDDLPLCCPMPKQRVWDAHPRVYLSIEDKGHAACPYCGAKYTLNQTD